MGERMSLLRKGLVVATCRALGVPVVVHLHAQMERFYGVLPGFLQHWARRVFLMADGVVVIAPAARRFVQDKLRVPARRVDIVINGVPEAIEFAEKPREGKHLLFVGNLSDRKGVLDPLGAVSSPGLDRSGLRVTLTGGGGLARYRRKARELGLESIVRFEGWCDQARTRELLATSHALVLPSHDEVLPLAILEALAHGVAVVTTPVGEIPALPSPAFPRGGAAGPAGGGSSPVSSVSIERAGFLADVFHGGQRAADRHAQSFDDFVQPHRGLTLRGQPGQVDEAAAGAPHIVPGCDFVHQAIEDVIAHEGAGRLRHLGIDSFCQ